MANLITFSRLLLMFVVIEMAYQPSSWLKLLDVPLLIFVFVTDGLDGYVARKRGETSQFGAIFDIAVDRIVELSMWVVLVHLGLAPVWVPLVFVIRGSIVDAIRARQTAAAPASPFDVMRSPLARFLVAGRFMRGFYAVMKAVVFCWLLLLQPLPDLVPAIWAEWSWLLHAISTGLIWIVVALCVARGLPVIVEFLAQQRQLPEAMR
jgi:CDP-diacylglycerol--glycerol-3-phosphate 3-phosphatidyltransferase